MASLEIVSNLKQITSGTVPTTTTLANGEFAYGLIDGKPKLYGNTAGVITDYSNSGIVYLGEFDDDASLIEYVIMNQLPTGIYTSLIYGANAQLFLWDAGDNYQAFIICNMGSPDGEPMAGLVTVKVTKTGEVLSLTPYDEIITREAMNATIQAATIVWAE